MSRRLVAPRKVALMHELRAYIEREVGRRSWEQRDLVQRSVATPAPPTIPGRILTPP